MRQKVVDRRAVRGREFRPFEAPGFGQIGASSPHGAGKRFGLDQRNLVEVAPQHTEPAAATTDDERERTIDAVSERTELSDMPVEPLAAAAACGELEGEDLDLGAFGDELAPAHIVMLRAGVDVQRGRQACGGHLRPGQQDPLHAVEIVGARHVGQHAVIRRADKHDTERLQRDENCAAFLQLPPAFDRVILVDTGHDDRRAFGEAEAIGEFGTGGDLRLAGCEIDKLIQRQRDHRLVEGRHTPVAVVNEGHDHRQIGNAVRRNARRVLEAQATHFAHAGDEKACVESADHVALALVLAGAEVAAIDDAGVGMDAATTVTLEAGRAAQRLRMLRRIIPKPLRLREAA